MVFSTKQRVGLIITDFPTSSGCSVISFAEPIKSLNNFNSFENNQNNARDNGANLPITKTRFYDIASNESEFSDLLEANRINFLQGGKGKILSWVMYRICIFSSWQQL